MTTVVVTTGIPSVEADETREVEEKIFNVLSKPFVSIREKDLEGTIYCLNARTF